MTAEAIASGFVLNSRVPQIPNWSINAGAQYALTTDVGRFTLRGDLSHKGNHFLTAADPTSYQASYTLYGARLSYEPRWTKGFEFAIDAQNLTNKTYAYYKATLAPTGEYVALPGAPRTIYGTIKYAF